MKRVLIILLAAIVNVAVFGQVVPSYSSPTDTSEYILKINKVNMKR